MLTNLQQSSIEQRIDRVAGEYYRQLSIIRIQDAVYFAGIPDETLEYFCLIFAREMVGQYRSESDNQIVRRVLSGALEAHGRTTAEFVRALSTAIEKTDGGRK